MSEDLDLNAVASASMSEAEPQTNSETTTESTSTATTPTTTAVTPEKATVNTEVPKVEKTVTQGTEQQKLSRRQQAAKEAADFRAKAEQRDLENQRRIQAYEAQLKQLQPLMPYASEIQKALELKKQQELANQYKLNPQLALEQRTQEMIQQAIAPYQAQAQQAEIMNFATQSINQIKQLAGSEESFNNLKPIMSNLLENIRNTDPDASDKLARNPEVLFRLARDYYNEQQTQVTAQKQQQETVENQKSKAEMAKFNGGISKPNKFAKAPVTQGREAARQNAFDYIQQLVK